MNELKLYRAILHTVGKSDEQIRAQFSSTIPTQKEIDLTRATYDAWDSLECIVMDDPFGRAGVYCFCSPTNEKGISKAKEATYLMEQDAMVGAYIDQRADFDRDYDNGDYSPCGCFIFQGDEVEIIGEINKAGGSNAEPFG